MSISGARIEQYRGGSLLATYQGPANRPGATQPLAGNTSSNPASAAATGWGCFERTGYEVWRPGDQFFIYGDFENVGLYLGPLYNQQAPSNLLIKGAGPGRSRFILSGPAPDSTLNQSLIYLDTSSDITFENIAALAKPTAAMNKALIYINGAHNPTFRHCAARDATTSKNQGNGFFSTGSCSGTLALPGCVSVNNGGGQYEDSGDPMHNFYINASTVDPKFTVEFDGLSEGVVYGHLFKSRAQVTKLTGATLNDTGTASFCVDAPNGGQLFLTKCNITRANKADNGPCVAWGEEIGTVPANPAPLIQIENNTLTVGAPTWDGTHPFFPFFFLPDHDYPGSTTWPGYPATITVNTFNGFETTGIPYQDFRGTD